MLYEIKIVHFLSCQSFTGQQYNIIGHSIEVLLMEARIEIRSVYSRIIQFFWKKPKLSESEIVYNAEEPDSSP